MILKGNTRKGGADLATHLSNEYDNARVEIAEVRGLFGQTLHGAFAEIEAVAAGTRCQKPLYSLSLSPPSPLSREQYSGAIDHIEAKLGLTDQPRAVVFHVKDGREHCHVVWSRIDLDSMRAIDIKHDHMKLRTSARELAHAYGLILPRGLAEDRGDARFERSPDVTYAEKAMAQASGIAPEQRRAAITAAYRSSDSVGALSAGLERAGYVLAKGERSAYVVVDRAGHVHSVARQIDGVKTREVKARLDALHVENLPTVAEALAQQTARQTAVAECLREQARQRGAKSAEDMKAKQETRRRAIDAKRQQLAITHGSERMAMRAAHRAEQGRPFNIIGGKIFDLVDRVPGLRSVIAPLRRNPIINAAERHRLEREALDRRHDRERHAISRLAAALGKIDARERRGLVRDLVHQTRVEDLLRQAQDEQQQRELRRPAGKELKADERRQRMAERLAEARQKPSSPRRSGPGIE